MANSHGGSLKAALVLTEALRESGIGAMKYQWYTAEELLVPSHPRFEHFRAQAFSLGEWDELIAFARGLGFPVIIDVFGENSAKHAMERDVAAFKIHSSDVLNLPLLELVGGSGRPVFLATSGSTHPELCDALNILEAAGCPGVILMHGFQSFPTRLEDTQLRGLKELKHRYRCLVGMADHVDAEDEMALYVPLLAVAAGASVVEKHVTINRNARGVDYHSSLEPLEMARLAQLLERTVVAIGPPDLPISEEEQSYRRSMKKTLVAQTSLAAGEELTVESVGYRRAVGEAHPCAWDEVVGRRTVQDIKAHQVITRAMVHQTTIVCVAVRMHSTRLPKKAMLPVAGQAAIEFLLDRLVRAGEPEAVVVCTSRSPDDAVLVEVAKRKGLPYVAGDEDDVMSRFLEAAERFGADNVVRVTGDDILVDPLCLDEAVRCHQEMNADYTSNKGLPSGTECEVITTRALQLAHRLAVDARHTEYMTWYLTDPRVFRLTRVPVAEELRRPYRLTIDTHEDLEVVRHVVEALLPQEPAFGVREIISYLDANPQIASINAHVGAEEVESTVNTSLMLERY